MNQSEYRLHVESPEKGPRVQTFHVTCRSASGAEELPGGAILKVCAEHRSGQQSLRVTREGNRFVVVWNRSDADTGRHRVTFDLYDANGEHLDHNECYENVEKTPLPIAKDAHFFGDRLKLFADVSSQPGSRFVQAEVTVRDGECREYLPPSGTSLELKDVSVCTQDTDTPLPTRTMQRRPNAWAVVFERPPQVSRFLLNASVVEHGEGGATQEIAKTSNAGLPIEPTSLPPGIPPFSEPVQSAASPTTSVSLQRSSRAPTENQILWTLIRNSTNALSFPVYSRFLDIVLCGEKGPLDTTEEGLIEAASNRLSASRLALPFPGVDAYRTLKAATEVFILLNSGVLPGANGQFLNVFGFDSTKQQENGRFGMPLLGDPQALYQQYLETVNGGGGLSAQTLPYLAIIRDRLQDAPIHLANQGFFECVGISQAKLSHPLLLELIWSYWIEESMSVQAIKALAQRFQNRRAAGERDPLAALEIDPLRPLSNLLWGYVQDEQHRLTVARRAHEYEHHYGLSLHGDAVRDVRPADRRSKFLESFHNLLHQVSQFFKQDDDTTVIADGFAVLNAIKETHFVLAQGAHNQFGDLPSTARQEMLMEHWLLARPEVRSFLGGRVMVPYPETWMDRVDHMKSLKGWTDTSVVHFRDLAAFGEQIVLSIRYDSWSQRNDPDSAANWARYWRPELQGYIHAYRAVTGINLSDEPTASGMVERALPPSVHLRRRLAAQVRG